MSANLHSARSRLLADFPPHSTVASKRAEGNAEHAVAEAKGYADGVGDKVVGGIKNTAGGIIGEHSMETEGKARVVSTQQQSLLGTSFKPSSLLLASALSSATSPWIQRGRPARWGASLAGR